MIQPNPDLRNLDPMSLLRADIADLKGKLAKAEAALDVMEQRASRAEIVLACMILDSEPHENDERYIMVPKYRYAHVAETNALQYMTGKAKGSGEESMLVRVVPRDEADPGQHGHPQP